MWDNWLFFFFSESYVSDENDGFAAADEMWRMFAVFTPAN